MADKIEKAIGRLTNDQVVELRERLERVAIVEQKEYRGTIAPIVRRAILIIVFIIGLVCVGIGLYYEVPSVAGYIGSQIHYIFSLPNPFKLWIVKLITLLGLSLMIYLIYLGVGWLDSSMAPEGRNESAGSNFIYGVGFFFTLLIIGTMIFVIAQ